MSEVMWCDIGQHPFPMNQPGRTTLKVEQQTQNQWGGYQPTDVVQDVCSACARDSGIRRIQDIPKQSQDQIDEMADAIRDGTATSRFRSRMQSAVKAITNGDTDAKTKLQQAKDRNYDPDYVAYLEEKVHEPLPE